MVSHVGNETAVFASKKIISNATFQVFLDKFMPEEDLAGIKTRIREQYDCQKAPYNGNYFSASVTSFAIHPSRAIHGRSAMPTLSQVKHT